MTIEDIGQLTPLDETLDHQIADTFAAVALPDYSWTQKIWGSLARKDGSLQVDFGLGKYHNRNVMDGFGGISRGNEQWTVRTSRALAPDFQDTKVGPVRYEIVDPLKKVRFALDKNDTQPISFDILFEGELPPFFEKRTRTRGAARVQQDLVRYHQPGKLSGWVELEGVRHTVDDTWFGFRDHSWGHRLGAGAPLIDIEPKALESERLRVLWGPMLLFRPDGSKYELMNYLWSADYWDYFSGHVNEVEGENKVKQTEIVRMVPDLEFDPSTRRFKRGKFELHIKTGETRILEVTALSDTGFYLRTGQYRGWKGGHHGSWRGAYHEDGEYIPNVLDVIGELGQFRDCPVSVREGDAVGFGIQESIYLGEMPEHGLPDDPKFSTSVF